MKTLIPSLLFISLILFQGCKKDSLPPIVVDQDYFPMKEGQEFNYLRMGISTQYPADSSFATSDTSFLTTPIFGNSRLDTVIWKVEKDTVVQNKMYKKLTDNYGVSTKLVRKDQSAYYSLEFLPGYLLQSSTEKLFLKKNVKVDDTWESQQEKFTVLSIKKKYRLNGIEYQNVVQIKGEFRIYNNLTAYYMYAEGIGQIYAYYPYPYSQRYEDIELKRMK